MPRIVLPASAAAAIVGVGACATVTAAAPGRLVALTSADGAGSVATMELGPPWTPAPGLASVGGRAVLRSHGNALWVVNGSPDDDVRGIDPDTWATVTTIPTGTGSDPQDIVFAEGTKAYVSLAGAAAVLLVDTGSGAVTGAVDLSAFADPDGVPDLGRMELHDGRVYVQVQRLSREGGAVTPVPPSMIAVIDAAADTLVDTDLQTPGRQAVVLTGLYPVGDMQVDGGDLYIMEQGAYEAIDEHGGIDRIDLATLTAAGFVTTEDELGGHADCFVLASPTRGYAVTHTDWTLSSHLTRFSRADGSSQGTVLEIAGTHTHELALDTETGLLYFPVSAADPGVRVFDTAADVPLTATSRPTGPAVDVLVVRPGADTAIPHSAGWRPGLGPAHPNPFSATTWFELRAPGQVTILDASGRTVRSLVRPGGSAGPGRLEWNGRDDAGRLVPAGVYFVRWESGGRAGARKVTRIP